MHQATANTVSPQLLPFDEANRALAGNVRPADWRNPEPRGRYNMVVLGGGTAGLVTAVGAAGLGARVALVERALLGGDCLNVGCVPSKAILRCARAAGEVRRAGAFGVRVPDGVGVDFDAVMRRMRGLRAAISPNDSARRLQSVGVDVFFGDARFAGGDVVEVNGKRLAFARACIATGARPAIPPIAGLADAGCLTNETLFSLTALPRRFAVVGGGPIGCEIAQAFARFGSTVTLVEAAPALLGREHPDAAAIIHRVLQRDGVDVLLGASVERVAVTPHGKLLHVRLASGARDVVIDELLVSVGRIPNVEGLELERAGVAYDGRAGIRVDDRLRTSNPRVYSAGDVCLPFKFTHTADATARIVLRNALFFGRASTRSLAVPWCTYTDPEVAHVELFGGEGRAGAAGVRSIRIELAEVDRARIDGADEGFLEVLVKDGSDRIVGATMVGTHAGENISELTAAMTAGVGLAKLAETIHCYPTQAEAIKRAADAFNRSRLTPAVKRVFSALLALRR